MYGYVGALTQQDEADFADFYSANHRSVHVAVWALIGDKDRAEEIAQEAFVRLVPHWRKVSRYERPEAWVSDPSLSDSPATTDSAGARSVR